MDISLPLDKMTRLELQWRDFGKISVVTPNPFLFMRVFISSISDIIACYLGLNKDRRFGEGPYWEYFTSGVLYAIWLSTVR